MSEENRGWKVFDTDSGVLIHTYRFGAGNVNALAVRGADGLLVFSPPYRAPASVFESLREHGEVRALVASNAYHHMGIPEWKARFPDAAVFAPAQGVERVRKQTGIEAVHPYSEATALTGDGLEIVDMPYYRTGEALVRIRSSRGVAWYVTDIILNIRKLPRNPLLSALVRLTASGPGPRWNKIGPTIMVRDKRALRQWLREAFARERPRWLIATHGEILDFEAEPESAKELFGA